MMNIGKWPKSSFLIPVLLLFIALVIKLPLLKEGGLGFFSDEGRYRWTLTVYLHQSFMTKSFLPYIKSIFDMQARPAYGLLYLPSLLITEITKNEIFGPIYNLLIVSLSVILIFLIVKKLYTKKTAFFASAFFFFSMCSSSYIRHMLPYDGALLVFLLAIYIFINTKSLFLLGTLIGLSFSSYPGNYYYIIPIPLSIFFITKTADLKTKIFKVLQFFAGFLSIMFIFETLSRLVNGPGSYFTSILDLSKTVNQGDYMPAGLFIFKYIFANDGVFGVVVLFIGIITLFNFCKTRTKTCLEKTLIFYAISIYLILEIMSFVSHKTVLYGRTVRMFYLFFMVLASVGLVNLLSKNKKWVLFFLAAVILLTVINWFPRYLNYINAIYPNDFYKKVMTFNKNNVEINNISPHIASIDDRDNVFALVFRDRYYLVNNEVLFFYYGMKKINCDKDIIIEADYVLPTYQPYLFEGWTEAMRESFYNDPPKYQLIYCK